MIKYFFSAEETDLLEPTLLDELICHISSLASVYHKPPTAFVEGKVTIISLLKSKQSGLGRRSSAAKKPQIKNFECFFKK